MENTEKEQNVSGEKPEDVVTPKVDIDEAEKRYKAELAGLNRKISELEKANKEKELEKMNETDRAKEEVRLAQIERDKYLTETVELKKTTAVLNEGLSKEFAQFITGNGDEEISAQIAVFKATVSAEADRLYKAEANKNFGGTKPSGGQPPESNTLQSAYDNAFKTKNFAQQTAILRQAAREGVKIIQSI